MVATESDMGMKVKVVKCKLVSGAKSFVSSDQLIGLPIWRAPIVAFFAG